MGDEMRYRLQNIYPTIVIHLAIQSSATMQTAIEFSLRKIIFIHYHYALFHRLILYNYFHFESFKYFMKRKHLYIEIPEMGDEMRYRLQKYFGDK
jgi:hypothetical protein